MQLTMLSPMKKLKLLQLAAKYGIQILQFRPGYVQVRIAKWRKYESQLNAMINSLNNYDEINSIIIDEHTHTVSIYYDEKMFSSETDIQYWFNIFEKHII